MTTRQLPGFSILLTQYALCKFILISTELLTLLSPFSSSASGLLLHNRASDFGEEVGIFSSTPPLHTSYAINPFPLVFSYHSFLLRGEIEPSTRLRQGLPERIRVQTKLYLQSLGTSCLGRVSPTFFPFPLSPRRRKLSDCIS